MGKNIIMIQGVLLSPQKKIQNEKGDFFHYLDFNRAIKIEIVYDTETITYE